MLAIAARKTRFNYVSVVPREHLDLDFAATISGAAKP
jgi:hypothetical protein